MNTEEPSSTLPATLSWVYSVLAGIFAAFVLFLVSEFLHGLTSLNDDIGLICYVVVAAAAGFAICRSQPKSVWFAPIICNAAGILSACIEPTFWRTSMWMIVGAGWGISLCAAVAGASIGRQSSTEPPATVTPPEHALH